MTAQTPTSGEIWRDTNLGAAVFVNGGYVEITVDYGITVLLPDEAVALADALAAAVAEAGALAARWDPVARRHRLDGLGITAADFYEKLKAYQ